MSLSERNIDLDRFYSLGKELRQAYDPDTAKFWRDSGNIEAILHSKDKKAEFHLIDDGNKKGRIGIFIHENGQTGGIGWYECCDNQQVANELLNWATRRLNERNVAEIVGPVDGSTWYNYRFNLTSNRPVFANEPFQPAYYPTQWESFGFERGSSYETTWSDFPPIDLLNPSQVQELLHSMGLKLHPFTPSLFMKTQRQFHEFVMRCFVSNPYFSGMKWEEYQSYTKNFDKILDSSCSFVAMEGDRPVSLVSCIKDIYSGMYKQSGETNPFFSQKKVILKTIATDPDWQGKQIGTLLVNAVLSKARELGHSKIVHALMQVDNISSKDGRRKFHTTPAVEYALYKMIPDE